jgi:tight adherence protein C
MDGPHRRRRQVTGTAAGAAAMAAGAALAGLLALSGSIPSRDARRTRLVRPPASGRARAHLTWLDRASRAMAHLLRLPTDDPRTTRRLGRAIVLAAIAAAVAPAGAVAVLAAAWARTRLLLVREGRHREREVRGSLPDAVDLLLLCTTAGTGLALAHGEVARCLSGPVASALAAADIQAAGGRPRADALVAALSPLGERAAALAHVLADHLRYGTPLGPELERLSLELRLDRRRAAEEDARRVPVRLLAPLVACTLPAFALLTVAPLLVVSLRHLPT